MKNTNKMIFFTFQVYFLRKQISSRLHISTKAYLNIKRKKSIKWKFLIVLSCCLFNSRTRLFRWWRCWWIDIDEPLNNRLALFSLFLSSNSFSFFMYWLDTKTIFQKILFKETNSTNADELKKDFLTKDFFSFNINLKQPVYVK